MAKIGLQDPVFVPISEETAGSLPTYDTTKGVAVGAAVAADISFTRSEAKLAANNSIVEVDNSFTGGSIKFTIDDLANAVRLQMLGDKEATDGVNTAIRSAGSYTSPKGGFGYISIKMKDGIKSYIAYWYYKTQWKITSESEHTKPESGVTFTTTDMEGEILPALDGEEIYRDFYTFTKLSDAQAWINAKAGIASASLTELSASIAAAEALESETYTSASWADVASTLADAKSVAALSYPFQAQIDAAKTALDAAVAALVTRT